VITACSPAWLAGSRFPILDPGTAGTGNSGCDSQKARDTTGGSRRDGLSGLKELARTLDGDSPGKLAAGKPVEEVTGARPICSDASGAAGATTTAAR
jgi:hypothetical protein